MIQRLFATAPTDPESRLWLWRIFFRPVRALVFLFLRIEVVGRDHVPASGAYILVANHIDWKDPPAISLALGTSIRWMAKVEAFDYPILGFVLRGIGNFGVRRGESDRHAIALALRVLANGRPLGFFPEGHRSENGRLQRGRPGIALLADRTDALIVPCGVAGTPEARPRVPRRTEITLRFGEPFRVSELPPEVRGDRQATTDAIMTRVAALLPRDMRGFYGAAVPNVPPANDGSK